MKDSHVNRLLGEVQSDMLRLAGKMRQFGEDGANEELLPGVGSIFDVVMLLCEACGDEGGMFRFVNKCEITGTMDNPMLTLTTSNSQKCGAVALASPGYADDEPDEYIPEENPHHFTGG